MTKPNPKDDLKDFLREVADESKAAGADAVRALAAHGERFRLARQSLQPTRSASAAMTRVRDGQRRVAAS